MGVRKPLVQHERGDKTGYWDGDGQQVGHLVEGEEEYMCGGRAHSGKMSYLIKTRDEQNRDKTHH